MSPERLKNIIVFNAIFILTACSDENLCELNKPEKEILDKAIYIFIMALIVAIFLSVLFSIYFIIRNAVKKTRIRTIYN